MGSLPASGIPVAAKLPVTYRKHDVRIKATDNRTDQVTVVTANRPALSRTITSGTIVRDDGSVVYNEDVAWGLQYDSRSTSARVARDGARDLRVGKGDNETIAVVPTGLAPNTPQIGLVHTGNRVVSRQSVDDSLISRTLASGAFD